MAALPSECNINVMCRFRPLNHMEEQIDSSFTAKFLSGNCCKVDDKTYFFDRVFQPLTSQEVIYEAAAKPLIANVLSGYNATIFAYGQTSSGKTHTMEGIVGDPVFQGIIPRVVGDIFKQVETADGTVKFTIKVSYFEIYMEKIRDLLNPTKKNLDIREDRNRVPYVKDCTERTVVNADEMMTAIEDGKAIKEIDSTKMNDRSSRSHCVFLIKVIQEQTVAEKKLIGKLCLVDLAGSEKVSKTGAEGKQLEEAKRINSSLSVLGKVINALSKGDAFIPYRECKLTRLLQESIGGNSRTTVIICCSPSSYNVEETKSTLQFGVSAKTIKNVVKVNEELTIDELKRRLEKEKETVRQQDRMMHAIGLEVEKWRNGSFVPRSEWVDLSKWQSNGFASPRKIVRLSMHNNAVGDVGPSTIDNPMEQPNDDFEEIDERRTDSEDGLQQKASLEMSAAFVAEKALLLTKLVEAECQKDRITCSIDEIKEQLGTVVSSLEGVGTEEMLAALAGPLDVLRDVKRKLELVNKEELPVESEPDSDEDEAADNMQLTSRQEDVTRQMEMLLHQIKEREELIQQTVANADSIEKMRNKYEAEMNDLNQKIQDLQRERDEIQQTAAKQSTVSKISEARRIRLQEVEKQLAEYRRKIQDLQKVEKLKEQNEQKIKSLRSEVDSMKSTRVKLMRQMREDNERYRKNQLKAEQEMNQIRQQGKRRQFEIEKAKQNMDKQLTVYRRKYDEAVAVNKRLQQQLELQTAARNDRFAQIPENGAFMQEIQAFLKDELNLEVNAEQARLCLSQLQHQRVQLRNELSKLQREKKRLGTNYKLQPPRKKMNLGEGRSSGETDDGDEELNQVNLNIASLEEEISIRDSEIDQLRKRVDSFDSKTQEQRWSNIRTVFHGICALKTLFSLAKEAQVNNLVTSSRLADAESKIEELKTNFELKEEGLRYEKRRVELLERKQLDDADARERSHQRQVSYLLQELLKNANDRKLDAETMSNVMQIYKDMKVMENLTEQLDRKDEDNKKLSQELTKAKIRGTGNRNYFGGIRASVGVSARRTSGHKDKSRHDLEETIVEEDVENEEENSSYQHNTRTTRRPPERFGKILDSTLVITPFTPSPPTPATPAEEIFNPRRSRARHQERRNSTFTKPSKKTDNEFDTTFVKNDNSLADSVANAGDNVATCSKYNNGNIDAEMKSPIAEAPRPLKRFFKPITSD